MKYFLLLLSLYWSTCTATQSLRAGMELSYPPFEMICNNGDPCGISVDLVHSLSQFLKQEIRIENIAFVGLIPALKNGTIDMVISSLTITPQRQKAIDFSNPYATTGLCLLISKKSSIQDIKQANATGKVVVVKSGTSGELYAAAHLQEATVRILDKEAICVLEVVQGKADAFIYDQLSVYTNWKKNPDTTRANLTPFQKEFWAFGVRKDNTPLLEQINQFIKTFRAEGGFDELANKYLPEQKKVFAEMGVPFVF